MFQITTVDKYQGQQNDYILLSLVRTKTVGHIRDVRRLIVALSRARLGLYIFARASLFENCFELSNAFKILTQRPLLLQLIPSEEYPCNRSIKYLPSNEETLTVENMPQMVQFVYQFYQQKIEEWKTKKPEVFEQFLDKTKEETNEEIIPESDVQMIEKEEERDDEEEDDLGFEKLTEDDTGKEDIVEDVHISDDDDKE